MKVVVDTSVWIAAILSNRGASFEIFRLALDNKFDLVVSHRIYEEFSRVVKRPEIVKMVRLQENEIKKLGYFLRKLKKPAAEKVKIVRDPKDDMFIDCALSFGAETIVSLDKDLLDIGKYEGISFLLPRNFLKKIREVGT